MLLPIVAYCFVLAKAAFTNHLDQYREREMPSISLTKRMANLSINNGNELNVDLVQHPFLEALMQKKVNRLKAFAQADPNSPWLKNQARKMQLGNQFLREQQIKAPLFWLGWAHHFRLFFWSDLLEVIPTVVADNLTLKCLLDGCTGDIPSVDVLLNTVFIAQLNFIKTHELDQQAFALKMRQLQAILSIRFSTLVYGMGDLKLMFKALALEYRRKRGRFSFFARSDLLVTLRPQRGGFTIDRLFAHPINGYHRCSDPQIKHPMTLNAEIDRTWQDVHDNASQFKWSVVQDKQQGHPTLTLISLLTRSIPDYRYSLEQLLARG